MKMNINNLDIHLNQLSHIRHEMSNPINSIIGYSGLILDILEEEDLFNENENNQLTTTEIQQINHKLITGLNFIQEKGENILMLIKTIFASEDQEQHLLPLENRLKNLKEKAEPHLKKIIEICKDLLKYPLADLKSDFQKIQQSSANLIDMINDYLKWSQTQEFNLKFEFNAPPDDSFFTASLHKEEVINPFAENVNLTTIQKIHQASEQINTKLQGCILVVDDKENNRELLSRRIKDQGYQVQTAKNGKEAIEQINTGKYDLILLDILMPEIDGYQVLKWLKNSQWFNIPVIMISALDELDSVVKCIEMGAEDYLQKPFNPVLLKARVNACLEKKKLRDQENLYLEQLAYANEEITQLNEKLKAENLRMSAELNIAKKIQQMVLPKEEEIEQIKDLDIAGYMESADEVGGDYYDVLYDNGVVKIGIGDVTGHGLESGVLMLMLQTTIRTLTESKEINPIHFLTTLNRTIFNNIQRMDLDRHLTLTILDYQDGKMTISGQHEKVILVKESGQLKIIDTNSLGFFIGLELEIEDFFDMKQIALEENDILVLYTDGITEAENINEDLYGLEKMCHIVQENRYLSAKEITEKIINDVKTFIGDQKIYDDITLLVIKRLATSEVHKLS